MNPIAQMEQLQIVAGIGSAVRRLLDAPWPE